MSNFAPMYDARAPTYDDSWHPLHAADFIKWSAASPGQCILDLACGTGLVTIPGKRAVGHGGTVTGVDYSQGMLKIAREKAISAALDVQFIQGDITRLYELGLRKVYDVVTCAACLPLLEDPGAAMRDWIGYLTAGGLLVVDMPTERSQLPALMFEKVVVEDLHRDFPSSGRRWIKGPDSLANLVRAAGFEVERSFVARGYGSQKTYSKGDADGLFDKLVRFTKGQPLDGEVRQKARALFHQRWLELSGEDGILREEEGFYIVVGRKP